VGEGPDKHAKLVSLVLVTRLWIRGLDREVPASPANAVQLRVRSHWQRRGIRQANPCEGALKGAAQRVRTA